MQSLSKQRRKAEVNFPTKYYGVQGKGPDSVREGNIKQQKGTLINSGGVIV